MQRVRVCFLNSKPAALSKDPLNTGLKSPQCSSIGPIHLRGSHKGRVALCRVSQLDGRWLVGAPALNSWLYHHHHCNGVIIDVHVVRLGLGEEQERHYFLNQNSSSWMPSTFEVGWGMRCRLHHEDVPSENTYSGRFVPWGWSPATFPLPPWCSSASSRFDWMDWALSLQFNTQRGQQVPFTVHPMELNVSRKTVSSFWPVLKTSHRVTSFLHRWFCCIV